MARKLTLLLLSVTVLFNAIDALNVAVVGGGIGGATFSYFTHKWRPDTNITLFEANSQVGGRLRETVIDGVLLEVGGDAWSTVNTYMCYMDKMMNDTITDSPVKSKYRKLGLGFDPRFPMHLGVWNGKGFENLDGLLALHPISDAALGVMYESMLSKLKTNYKSRDESATGNTTFQTIAEFLQPGGLLAEATTSTTAAFKKNLVDLTFAQSTVEPATRTIYGQGLEINEFATMVVMAAMFSTQYSYSTGNSQLVAKLIQTSGADLRLNTPVTGVTRLADNTYTVTSKDGQTVHVDAVVLAAPLEFLNVTFTNIPEVQNISHREYVSCYVTHVLANALNVSFFGLKNSSDLPQYILTTTAGAKNPLTPFEQLSNQGKGDSGLTIFKLFSKVDVRPFLDLYFLQIKEIHVHHWPYTFPILDPIPATSFQPHIIRPGLFYLNTMDSVSTAMEASAIVGRNVALLVKNM